MESESFRTYVEQVHRRWLGDTLGLPFGDDIDLAGDGTAIELKCRLNRWWPSFAVHHYQISTFKEKHPDKELYWAFLLYGLSKPVEGIKRNIGRCVRNRQAWCLEWDWVRRYKVHRPKTGPYVYVHVRDFPPVSDFKTIQNPGGTLYIPKGSSLEALAATAMPR